MPVRLVTVHACMLDAHCNDYVTVLQVLAVRIV